MADKTDAIEQLDDGTPVFRGTAVPVQALLEHLQAGGRLTDFVNEHPSVDPDVAVQVMELALEATEGVEKDQDEAPGT